MRRVMTEEIDHSDLRGEIERLERRMEELAETIAKCRKFIVASKVAVAAGAAILLALLLGAVRFDPTAMIAGFTAVIGGAVLLGSNKSTREEASAALQSAQEQRAELIDHIDMRPVEAAQSISRTLH